MPMGIFSIFGVSSNEAVRQYCRAWDRAQTNDSAVLESDPHEERARNAAALLKTDPDTAFPILLALAEAGSVWSMLQVAFCYLEGRGVEPSAASAEEWYRRAFEGGSQRALLDYCAVLGRRGDLDLREAAYSAGAAKDWAPALCGLAQVRMMRSKSRRTAREVRPLVERAAELGKPGGEVVARQENDVGPIRPSRHRARAADDVEARHGFARRAGIGTLAAPEGVRRSRQACPD